MASFRKLPRQGDTANGELRASDVGPIPRQFLTGVEHFFGAHADLTLLNKLLRGQVPEGAVRPALIVIGPPQFDDQLGLRQRRELVHVQTLIA